MADSPLHHRHDKNTSYKHQTATEHSEMLGNNSVSVAQRFFIALVALERKQGFHLMGNKYNVNKIVTRQLKTFNIISIHGN